MRAPDPSREQGTTYIEVLVVTILLSVIGAMVLSATLSAFRSAAATEARVDAVQELELAMWQVSRDLRAADPLEFYFDDSDAMLGSCYSRGGDRYLVTYSVEETAEEPGDLRQLVRSDSGRTLVTALDNDPDDPEEAVFTYLDRDGVQIQCDDTCDVDLFRTHQVQVRLVRRIEGAAPAIVQTQVSVRNLRHGGTSDESNC